MSQEQNFLDAIAESPDNDQLRLVYADYLEERQDLRAEYLRLEIAFNSAESKSERDELRVRLKEKISQLQSSQEQKWILKVQRLAVENCPTTKTHERKSANMMRNLSRRKRKEKLEKEEEKKPNVEFLFKCDQNWLELEETTDQRIRFCSKCKELVYFSDTVEEANNHAIQRRCVAICTAQERSEGDLVDFDPTQIMMGAMAPMFDFEEDSGVGKIESSE